MHKNLKFTFVLLLVVLGQTALMLLAGGLRINGHEADLLHVLDVISRMVAGDRPSVDFMTPLGITAFAPFAGLLALGTSHAKAILLGSGLVACLFLPAILHVAGSRMGGVVKWGFGLGLVIMMTAVVYGGDQATISISMYYNRWAWTISFLMLAVLFLTPGDETPLRDGVIVGLGVGILATLKMTFAVALGPVVLLGLILRRDGRFFAALAVSLLIWLAAVTILAGGLDYWVSYVRDLLYVATSNLRARPGLSFGDVAAAPAYLPATAVLLLTVVFWRRVGLAREGLLLLVAAPGFIYITFQNWGNDPKWLFVLGIFLLVLRERAAGKTWFGADGRHASSLMATACLVMIAPSILNMGYSTVRHLALSADRFTPIFEGSDIEFEIARNFEGAGSVGLPPVAITSEPVSIADDEVVETVLNGEVLDYCQMTTGLLGVTRSIQEELGARNLVSGKRVLVGDIYDFLWLAGPFERNRGMAPWYYGAPSGFNGTELLVVPLCPISDRARRVKIQSIVDRGWGLSEVFRTEHFIVLSVES